MCRFVWHRAVCGHKSTPQLKVCEAAGVPPGCDWFWDPPLEEVKDDLAEPDDGEYGVYEVRSRVEYHNFPRFQALEEAARRATEGPLVWCMKLRAEWYQLHFHDRRLPADQQHIRSKPTPYEKTERRGARILGHREKP
ncbi:hypothetical protein PSPO01_14833 [Paraphaeosphaeria sporulosa]